MNAMTLQVVVDETEAGPVPRIVTVWRTPESQLVTAEEANRQMQELYGVSWTGVQGEQFAIDGQPATEDQMPFTIDRTSWPPKVILYPDRPQYEIVVESATHLGDDADWSPLMMASVPSGVTNHVEDLTQSGAAFYRVRMKGPDEAFQPAGVIAAGIGLGLLGAGAYICWRVAKCAQDRARKNQQAISNAQNRSEIILPREWLRHYSFPSA